MTFWEKIRKWMEEIVGTVRTIFRGTVNTDSPRGPVPPEPEGNYPLVVQVNMKVFTQSTIVSFELDKDGELVWAIFDRQLTFNKNDITTGSYAAAWGAEEVLANEFKEFEVTSLAQGYKYVFAFYTRNAEDESGIIDILEFETSGDAPDIIRFYGDEYGDEYS